MTPRPLHNGEDPGGWWEGDGKPVQQGTRYVAATYLPTNPTALLA
jgi:hypothetical protein